MADTSAGERAPVLSTEGDPVLELVLALESAHHRPPPRLCAQAGEMSAVSDGSTSARTVVVLTPGAPMRAFLTDWYGLAAQGRVDVEGSPRLRDAARLFCRHSAATSFAGVPTWVQPALWWAFSRGAA